MSASESAPSWKHLLLLILLILATAGLVVGVEVQVGTDAGVQEFLPTTLGDSWVGDEVLFCQDPACSRSWLTRDVEPNAEGIRTCPANWQGEPCGGELHTMSWGERAILPKDTLILKKQYKHLKDPDRKVFCSVVFSGKNRDSIHRPETCMVGQGHTIENSPIIEVPLPDREPLRVMVLHLSRQIAPGRFHYSYYAYWFVGKGRETPLHHERMLWMAMDRVFKNITHRWAYIAVSGQRSADHQDTSHYDEIRDVVSKLYPQIQIPDPS